MSLLIGFDGHYDFAEIGESYTENNVPYVGLRALPASLNVASVALIYAIMKQSGYTTLACALSSCMYIFGKQNVKSLQYLFNNISFKTTHSLHSIVLFFSTALLFFICFWQCILIYDFLNWGIGTCILCGQSKGGKNAYARLKSSFTAGWWIWMMAAGSSMAMTLRYLEIQEVSVQEDWFFDVRSVKMVGLFIVGSIGVAVVVDLWNLLDVRNGLLLVFL